MKFFILLIASFMLIACGNDSRNGGATNALCQDSNLNLDNYNQPNSESLSVPGDPNKSDQPKAGEGRYVLVSSLLHFHDKNITADDGKHLQYLISVNALPKNKDDIDNNKQRFQPQVSCVSGMAEGLNGNLVLETSLPMELNAILDSTETLIEPSALKDLRLTYNSDFSTNITSKDSANKSLGGIDEINKGGSDRVTNLTRTKSTTGVPSSTYQLQSRVTIKNKVVTVVNNYKLCTPPPTGFEYKVRYPNKFSKLSKEYEDCLSVEQVLINR